MTILFEKIKDETKYDNNADLVIRENIGEVFRKVMEKSNNRILLSDT